MWGLGSWCFRDLFLLPLQYFYFSFAPPQHLFLAKAPPATLLEYPISPFSILRLLERPEQVADTLDLLASNFAATFANEDPLIRSLALINSWALQSEIMVYL